MSTPKDRIHSEPELTDEQIMELEQKMLQEVRGDIPLISSPVSLDELAQEYKEGNPVFLQKIRELSETFSTYRKVRGDGDCFYRTFAYGFLSQTNSNTSSALRTSVQVLKDAGFEELSYEVFSDILFEVVEKLPGSDLQSIMNNPEESNAIVVYLRFLTSAWIKTHPDDYAPFLEMDLKHYCEMNIEAMGREADHVMISALVSALNVKVDIHYLDRSEGDKAILHEFGTRSGKNAVITCLYRPGHYDLLETLPF